MIRYKLTNQECKTFGGCEWKVGEWKEAEGEGSGNLCSNSWLHCYSDPILALLLNPIHAGVKNPRLWEVEVDGDCKTDRGLKEGWRRMRLVKEIPLPELSTEQRIYSAILCAKEVHPEPKWNTWADNWLSGVGRSRAAAACAANSAYSPIHDYARAADRSAANADNAAYFAALAVVYSVTSDRDAAIAISYAVEAKRLDLIGLVHKVIGTNQR
jgi:hypothetical protein